MLLLSAKAAQAADNCPYRSADGAERATELPRRVSEGVKKKGCTLSGQPSIGHFLQPNQLEGFIDEHDQWKRLDERAVATVLLS